MGCGSSNNNQETINPRQFKQAQKPQKKRLSQYQQQEDSNYKENEEAQQIFGGEEIVVEQEFVKTQKLDPTNISTQVVTQEELGKYQIALKGLGDGQKFEDQDFLPNQESLTRDISYMKCASDYQWLRAAEIFKDVKINIFQGKIEPNDIIQGALGDCYYLSSLSVLAERPNYIKKLFVNKEYSEQGVYGVYMFIDGEFQEIIVDDFFPSKDGRCVFSRSNEKDLEQFGAELWVLIMEKAYAKAFKGYNQIVSGHSGNAIRDLTGSPMENIDTKKGKSSEEIWDFIKEHDDAGHLLTAGTANVDEGIEVDTGEGIVSGHAYAILDARIVNGNEKIIQMRNPWGQNEWTGDWSDKSSKWTDKLKKELNFVDADDGVFWIGINDFIDQFADVNTNFLNDNYLYSSQRIQLSESNHIAVVKFTVKEDNTHGFIQINQKDRRHFEPKDNYEYSIAHMFICRGDFKQWIDCKTNSSRNTTIEGEFNKGTYIAFVDMGWSPQRCGSESIVISSYSSGQIQFVQDYQTYSLGDDLSILDKILLCQPNIKKDKMHYYEDDKDVSRYQGEAGGYVYFQFINRSKNGSTLEERVVLQDLQNLSICAPFTDSNEFSVTVKPQEVKVVKFRTGNESDSYSYACAYAGHIEQSAEQIQQKLLEYAADNRQRRGESIEVYLTTYQTSKGYIMYYQNETEQKYVEDLNMELNNLKVVNSDGTDGGAQMKIEINAGETFQFSLEVVDKSQGCSYSQSYGYGLQ